MPKSKFYYSNIPGTSHINLWMPDPYGFDIGINECGYEYCAPGHYWKGIRNVYVLHYVLSGQGTLLCRGTEYKIKEKMGFLISPGVECQWTASEADPWEYRWVAFSGNKAWQIMRLCSINNQNPVFQFEQNDQGEFLQQRMQQIYEAAKTPYLANLVMIGYLNLLLAEFIRHFPDSNIEIHDASLQSVNNAVRYMQEHYLEDITVDKVAKVIGLNRSHLYKLFIKYINISPSEYISNLRLEHASDLLRNDTMSVSEIAYTSGFHDAYSFSRVFKEKKGMAPSAYRKMMQDE